MKAQTENCKKHRVLYVDDEEKSLKYFEKFFGETYEVLLASSVDEGWAKVKELNGDLSLVITDQRMPEKQGVELLSQLRREYPKIMRILTTAFSDLDSAIDAVNDGFIYRYVTKPWVIDDLKVVIKQTLDYYEILGERDQLINEKLSVKLRLLMSNRIHGLTLMGQTVSDQFPGVEGAISAYLQHIPEEVVNTLKSSQEIGTGDFFRNSETSQHQVRLGLMRLAKSWGQEVHRLPKEEVEEVDFKAWLEENRETVKTAADGNAVELKFESPLPKVRLQRKRVSAALAGVVSAITQLGEAGNQISISAKEHQSNVQLAVSKSSEAWNSEQLRNLYSILVADEVNTGSMQLFTASLILYHHGGKVVMDASRGAISLIIPTSPSDDQPTNKQDPVEDLMNLFARWDAE